MGYGTFGYKLATFTLAGALAGLAGYLWAAQTGYVNPELMGFPHEPRTDMMVILGGMGNLAGRHRRRFAFEYLLHLFKDLPRGRLQLGEALAAVMACYRVGGCGCPRGLLGLFERMSRCARRRPVSSPLLSAKRLTKRLAGLAAVQ
jgi:branched-chain amino acid transport system permease protein